MCISFDLITRLMKISSFRRQHEGWAPLHCNTQVENVKVPIVHKQIHTVEKKTPSGLAGGRLLQFLNLRPKQQIILSWKILPYFWINIINVKMNSRTNLVLNLLLFFLTSLLLYIYTALFILPTATHKADWIHIGPSQSEVWIWKWSSDNKLQKVTSWS